MYVKTIFKDASVVGYTKKKYANNTTRHGLSKIENRYSQMKEKLNSLYSVK
jgi:hypothetical protein